MLVTSPVLAMITVLARSSLLADNTSEPEAATNNTLSSAAPTPTRRRRGECSRRPRALEARAASGDNVVTEGFAYTCSLSLVRAGTIHVCNHMRHYGGYAHCMAFDWRRQASLTVATSICVYRLV